MKFSKAVMVCLLLAWLTACGPVRRVAEPPPDEGPALPAGAQRFDIDPAASQLRILVYRAGALASLGHNHVISSSGLSGYVAVAPALADSVFVLTLPVASLEVDRPELRAEEGEDFPGPLDAEAIAGTRSNMLGERLLNAAMFPEIRLQSRSVSGRLPELTIAAELRVKDRLSEITVPVSVDLQGETLTASGRFTLAQSALGLEPFSVMLGALAVRDELDLRFTIVARRKIND